MDRTEERNGGTGAEKDSAPVPARLSPRFLPEDPKEAERVFNSLPIKDQIDLLLQSHGKERLHYLSLVKNPEQLVQRLPELEVFLTVKEIGDKDAIPFIAITTPEQFQFLLDLDFWKKDELDPAKILHWMEVLLECGEKKIAQFIQSTDLEFIALLLKKFLRVSTLEGEPLEVEEIVPPFTLDNYYFVHFVEKETRAVLERFLKIFSLIEPGGYQKLMEALVWELDSELEEGEFRIRNARLSEYGFPDFEESLEIYRFVNPDALLSKGTTPPAVRQKEGEKSLPTFYLAYVGEGPFFSAALAKIADPEERDRLKIEMTVLSNRAMVAEAIDLSRFEEIERITKKVVHYLNFGLQYLSGREEARSVEILRSLPLQKIFQAGVSLTFLVEREAEGLLRGSWFNWDRGNLVFLDPPYLERFEGLLKKRPSLDRNGRSEDFKDLRDLEESEDFIKGVEAAVLFLEKQLNLSPVSLKDLDLKGCHPEDWRGITLSTLFLTAFSNRVLKGSFRFEAIDKAKLRDLFSRIFDRNEEGKGVVRMEIREGLRDWFDSIEGDESRQNHLRAFGDFCLDLLEEQFGKIPPGEEIDPRFVKGLLISAGDRS